VREPIILASARKHGVSDDDILHAFRNPLLARGQDDGLTMIVGPKRDGGLIEVGACRDDGNVLIVHAMDPARRKFLRRR
jgi:hypothetical protein